MKSEDIKEFAEFFTKSRVKIGEDEFPLAYLLEDTSKCTLTIIFRPAKNEKKGVGVTIDFNELPVDMRETFFKGDTFNLQITFS